jgi:L,D-transpeptidase YbiS
MPGHIKVSIFDQCLKYSDKGIVTTYSISTAKNGAGEKKHSEKTPLGKHIIRAKIGHDNVENTVFVGRRASGEIYSEDLALKYPHRDWILTRIMWLSGCELGKNRLGNVDSMQRYIYIHGTPDLEPMSIPLSHGCIRMRNKDIISLFDQVAYDAPVLIQQKSFN